MSWFQWLAAAAASSAGGDTVDLSGAPATATATAVSPSVVLGSVSVSPAAATATATAVTPTVVLGSISVAPAAAQATATAVSPSVIHGSLTITPAAASATATAVDPTVEITGGGGGDVTVDLTSAPALATATAIAPSVVLGSLSVAPEPANATATAVSPSVILGSVSVNLATAPATVTATAISPTVITAAAAQRGTPTTSGRVLAWPVMVARVTTLPTMSGERAMMTRYTAEVLADSPVGYWRLGETSGTQAADSSGFGRHGTYVGGVTLNQAGAILDGDAAARFNGTSGYVVIPDNAAWNLGNFTLEAWINTTNAGAGRCRIISQQGAEGYWLMSLLNNALECGSSLDGFLAASPGLKNSGTWRHVAVVRNRPAGTVRWYMDGAWDGGQVTISPAAGSYAITSPVYISRYPVSASEYFTGLIDEVAIFPTALSEARIAAHYAARVQTVARGAAITMSRRATTGAATSGRRLAEPTMSGSERS